MSLFQNSVEVKYLNQIDSKLLDSKFDEFKAYFGNPAIQENIRNSKEEQFQEGFLRELFVKILGYTLNPSPNYNLTTEYKNIKDSKKADGAIISTRGHVPLVKAVIELKGTDTIDLGKIETQAFGYKNNQPDCVYVITSNFEKLRFYIDNAIEHIEFNLFTLTKQEFQLLYLCLSFASIEKNIPKKIKDESVSKEDDVTKKLYQDYSLFKRELHQNLVALNPQFDPLTLFKKSQKLLDRFLFLFFAEDRQLLPPNSVRLVLNDWKELQERDEIVPLYDRFKKYFGYLNTGFKGKRYDVFAYNGGLFLPDEVLDNVKINDDLLFKHTWKLSEYNFVSEVDVNILGHIFENSLNELEEINAQLEGKEVDKTKTKRKKDGVFYTPKYITKYIVENTVGRLCAEKKTELQINDEDYTTDKKRQLKTKQALLDKLNTYSNWLLQLTICDPACGSGAFLNQALDFLISEHRYIDELKAKLYGVPMVLSDIRKSILENNIFGVDINEESVEIAKLALWLRTAEPNRKLNDLNNNIKCGNSLIDDPAVAGDKAFNWQKEFPKVFVEKEKKAWHITTATHNSRYSQRMFDNHVKLGEPVWLSEKEEIIVSQTLADIVKKDKLNVLAYNICGDHMHILLVCEEKEVPKIVGKIKAMSARACNIEMGRTIPIEETTREHAPLSRTGTDTFPLSDISAISPSITSSTFSPDKASTREHTPLSKTGTYTVSSSETDRDRDRDRETRGHVPLSYSDSDTDSETETDSSSKKNSNYTEKGITQAHLWTQKFGCKEITSDEQLNNTLAYIQNNRNKHELPFNKGLQPLIDEICCTTEHAFRTEYGGGFDVIIGNPPYGATFNDEEKKYISNFKTYKYRFESYVYFYEIALRISKNSGFIGYITPELWLSLENCEPLRSFIFSNSDLLELSIIGENVFNDAVVNTVIAIIYNGKKHNEFTIIKNGIKSIYLYDDWKQARLLAIDYRITKIEQKIIEKIERNSINLKEFGEVIQGITPYDKYRGQDSELIKSRGYHFNFKKDDTCGKWLKGEDLNRYSLSWSGEWLSYGEWLAAPREKKYFEGYRILFREIPGKNRRIQAVITNETSYYGHSITPFILNDRDNIDILKKILCIVNSKTLSWYGGLKLSNFGKEIFPKLNPQDIKLLPICIDIKSTMEPMSEKADLTLTLINELQELSQKFQRTIQRKFNLEELPAKLQDWYLLSYSGFIKELAKKKIKLSLSEEAEWETYFQEESKKALEIKTKIEITDKEIDQMVYKLYDLTPEEIEIIENSIK
ncbi:MAG: N-6 DNA methylase [Bacteroidota bacterium]|nr:MAG: N-6 DNA methylase [Bacteroidota bacterium]